MCRFVCKQCGSEQLSYKKYAKCITQVEMHADGRMEYLASVTDEDDFLATENGFICYDCGTFVEHFGCRMETEQHLRSYWSMSPELRKQQEDDMRTTLPQLLRKKRKMISSNLWKAMQWYRSRRV